MVKHSSFETWCSETIASVIEYLRMSSNMLYFKMKNYVEVMRIRESIQFMVKHGVFEK